MIKQKTNFIKFREIENQKRKIKSRVENEKFSEIWNDARFNTM